jgi:hypothetical protein
MLPLISAQIVGASYFQAIGDAKKAAFLRLLRQVFLLIPLLLILPNFLGLNGVWGAGALSDLISSLIAIVSTLSKGSVISDYSPYSAPISKAKYPHSHIKFLKFFSRYSQISSWSYPIIRDITTI